MGPGPEMLRRLLLGFITALIVARPLVLGEDPGLLVDGLSDASNLVMTQLWLVAAVGWGLWRMWSRQGTWHGSLIEVGLLGVVASTAASAVAAASYHHPAYLIAWEWFVLLIVFGLVRQLARTPGDNQRLLAAVVASGVSLSVYAFFQTQVELPQLRAEVSAKYEKALQEATEQGRAMDPAIARLFKRVHDNNAFATFAHPNSFAGYLALLFPAAVGGAWLSWRSRHWCWHTASVAMAAALVAFGLWLTRSRGAILGSVIVGVGLLGAYFKGPRAAASRPQSHIRRALLPLGLLLGLAFGAIAALFYAKEGIDLARQSLDKRWDYWTATWRMITDGKYPLHFWLGVGPGNFSRFYPRYMAETAFEQVTDPHNFILETWASSGVVALAVLLATLGLFFWKTRAAWGASDGSAPAQPTLADSGDANGGFATRWEFYIGGMVGLLLGFILSAPNLGADDLIIAGLIAGGRSIIWFATFALFETVPWTTSARRLVLTAGLATLLLNLLISGGIGFPSVAQPLWFVAALALNTFPSYAVSRGNGSWFGIIWPLPVLATVCVFYLMLSLIPISNGVSYMTTARAQHATWYKAMSAELSRKLKDGAQRDAQHLIYNNLNFLDRTYLPLLRKALQEDPGYAYPLRELARWTGERYILSRDARFRQDAQRKAHELVTKIDPESKEGYLTQFWLNLQFGQIAANSQEKRAFYQLAVQSLAEAVKRDPTDAAGRLQYADILFRTGDPVEGRTQGREALRLDELATDPLRKLSPSQREEVAKWLAAPAGS
jgi:hypothetical protein